MNAPHIAAAELLDTYGDRLFRYCWSMLRSRETAQIALRDTLLAAQAQIAQAQIARAQIARAQIARLADPEDLESLGSWLYSCARAECARHRAVPAAQADEAPRRPGRNDADSRLMAWHAAMSLEAGEFEALELASRHDVDPGQPEPLRGHAAGRAERDADGGGQPGRQPGERAPVLRAARLRAAAGPGQLDGAAGRLRRPVASASVAIRPGALAVPVGHRVPSPPSSLRP
jgi:hypothetical protein